MGSGLAFILGFIAGVILAGSALAYAVYRSAVNDGSQSWEDGQ